MARLFPSSFAVVLAEQQSGKVHRLSQCERSPCPNP